MKSILEELFYGNLCPNTDCRNNEKETKELIVYIADHHETLLTGDIRICFQAWYEDSNRNVLYLRELKRCLHDRIYTKTPNK